ncbi:MAG: hypothetical protein LBU04_02200 [Christensenellaceae bacterium]|jgi:hypothetical protein|nr:hypothetical protein [Christensenellaceae bacterium]
MKNKKNKRNQAITETPSTIARSSVVERQPQSGPFPMAQQSGMAYNLPNTGNFGVIPNSMPLGLPQFTSVDEYGRIFTPVLTYGPQPNSAPVPVPIPSQIVQLTPIVSPVAFVPYSTQNQGLYQFDEDDAQ